MPLAPIYCDGCGQLADQAHMTRRLQRLEKLTRYRPIHVQALFLAAASPVSDLDYLYSAGYEFRGEGLALLRALGIEFDGKSSDAVLADFQRRGYLLAHVLECPISLDIDGLLTAVKQRLAATAVRIRRSLKPKRLILLGRELDPFAAQLAEALPGIPTVPGRLEPGSLAAALNPTHAAAL